jgi:hypothetical protein
MDDRNAPAARGDILDVQRGMNDGYAALNESCQMLRSEMQHMHKDLVERLAGIQTEMLKAFYSFTHSNNTRVAEIEGSETAIRGRIATLEDRVLEIEKRLNIPPAA